MSVGSRDDAARGLIIDDLEDFEGDQNLSNGDPAFEASPSLKNIVIHAYPSDLKTHGTSTKPGASDEDS